MVIAKNLKNVMVLSLDRWIGKAAIVTGASSGIGASIAEKLVEAGLQVAGLARRKDRLDELADKLSGKPGKFHPIQADLSKEDEILSAFEWVKTNLGPIHILINNAGILNLGLVTEGQTKNWQDVLGINVVALSIATREAIKDMKGNKVHGHIININSVAGHYIPNVNADMYVASKHGVTALTECVRRELASADSKIKISSISPGGTDTEIIPKGVRDSEAYKEAKKAKSILDPEDVADAVSYVLSTPPHVQVHELMIRCVGDKN